MYLQVFIKHSVQTHIFTSDAFVVNKASRYDIKGRNLTSIYQTFSSNTYIHLRYTSMKANATVAANNITKIMSAVGNSGAVILNVTGPTEDQIATINKYVPDKTNVILISGILGVVVATVGFFIDSIFTFTSKTKKKSRKSSPRDKLDQIKISNN